MARCFPLTNAIYLRKRNIIRKSILFDWCIGKSEYRAKTLAFQIDDWMYALRPLEGNTGSHTTMGGEVSLVFFPIGEEGLRILREIADIQNGEFDATLDVRLLSTDDKLHILKRHGIRIFC